MTGLHEGEVQIVVDRIVAVLQTTDLYWQFCVCTKLLEPLGAKAVAALPVLIQPRFLRHEQSAWRQFAVRAIGKIGLPAQSALPHLIEAQRDADEQVRREAAEAIKEVS